MSNFVEGMDNIVQQPPQRPSNGEAGAGDQQQPRQHPPPLEFNAFGPFEFSPDCSSDEEFVRRLVLLNFSLYQMISYIMN